MISKTSTLLCFGVALLFAAIQVLEVHGSINGGSVYLQRTNYSMEDMERFMLAMEFSDHIRDYFRQTKELMIEISKKGNMYTITKIASQTTWSLTFESGKEFDAKLADGRMVKSTVTVDEGKRTIHRVFKMNGFEATSDYLFRDKGFELTMKAKDAKVVLLYDELERGGSGHL